MAKAAVATEGILATLGSSTVGSTLIETGLNVGISVGGNLITAGSAALRGRKDEAAQVLAELPWNALRIAIVGSAGAVVSEKLRGPLFNSVFAASVQVGFNAIRGNELMDDVKEVFVEDLVAEATFSKFHHADTAKRLQAATTPGETIHLRLPHEGMKVAAKWVFAGAATAGLVALIKSDGHEKVEVPAGDLLENNANLKMLLERPPLKNKDAATPEFNVGAPLQERIAALRPDDAERALGAAEREPELRTFMEEHPGGARIVGAMGEQSFFAVFGEGPYTADQMRFAQALGNDFTKLGRTNPSEAAKMYAASKAGLDVVASAREHGFDAALAAAKLYNASPQAYKALLAKHPPAEAMTALKRDYPSAAKEGARLRVSPRSKISPRASAARRKTKAGSRRTSLGSTAGATVSSCKRRSNRSP